MFGKCVTALALSGSLALSSGAAVATAKPVSARAALAGCTPSNASPLVQKIGSSISGAGRFLNCTGSPYATITLQRLRWYGWQNLDSASGTLYPGATYWWVSWNCANAGTYTYRTIMTGRNNGGSPWTRESGHLRVAC
jgi:hypothetical protein